MQRRKEIVWLFVVFILCLSVRVYFIGEKKGLDGDEHTSFTLAYNAVGWGENAYQEGKYEAENLRKILFVDDCGGWKGYFSDIKSLWTDNRDPSHASLYYMLLRTALIGQNSTVLSDAVWRACGLNLLLFAVSFVLMALLLFRIFPNCRWIPFILLVAYINPVSVSITLLIREYQAAEMFLVAFALVAVWVYGNVKENKPILEFMPVLAFSVIAALLVSVGYFNAFFVIAVSLFCVYNLVVSKQYLQLAFFPIVAALSVLLCWLFYHGFFNFFGDARTGEVTTKLSGENFFSNIYYSGGAAVKLLVFDVFGYLMLAFLTGSAIYFVAKKRRLPRIDNVWIFVIAYICFGVVMILSTWKLSRYVSAYIPMMLVPVAYCVVKVLRSWKIVVAVAVIALSQTLFAGKVKFLMGDFADFPNDRVVYLYATYDGDRNTLSLLIPHLHDGQKVQVISDINQISDYNANGEAVVFADNDMQALLDCPNLESATQFNPWQMMYVVNYK